MQEQNLSFSFTGKGSEYFRIWIVNLLLTVLTLGIYSAWAKVRRMQYFHRHTWLNNSNFDYHGNPIAILKGRLIAFALLASYQIAIQTKPVLGLVLLLLIILVFPVLLVKSFRFRLYNTSYRGLRFNFAGSIKTAYMKFLVLPFFSLITLYLLAPFTHQRIKAYQHNHSRFGQTSFSFTAGVGSFYLVYLMAFALMMGIGILFGISTFSIFKGVLSDTHNPRNFVLFMVGFYGLIILASFFVVPYFVSRIQNLVWNNTKLDNHQFSCNLSALRLGWLYISNFMFIILTLGLFKPFADIRLARYRIEQMAMLPSGDLDHYLASEQQNVSATGEETAEMFDIDIAL